MPPKTGNTYVTDAATGASTIVIAHIMNAEQTRSMAVVSGGPVDSQHQGPLTFARDRTHVSKRSRVLRMNTSVYRVRTDDRGPTAPTAAVDDVDNPHSGITSYGRRCRPL